jgi:hypothetical protein
LASGNSQAIATALQLNLTLGTTTAIEIDISKNQVLLLKSLMTSEMIFGSYNLNTILQKSLINSIFIYKSQITNQIKSTSKIK